MTANKDLKKRIRARQAKNGESYTTARSHIIRARDTQDSNQASESERITAIVLKRNELSLRVRVPGNKDTITLRMSGNDLIGVVPGQFIEATLTKRWTWRGDAYAQGTTNRVWTDIPALGLEPLPLKDKGLRKLKDIEEPFREPDPYAKMWDFFASVPIRAYEFDGIAWGDGASADQDDPDVDAVSEAVEIGASDPDAARDLLMVLLLKDLRCIDAHVHLGDLVFDRWPESAIKHYSIAVGIGELSLGADFNGMLPWGHLFNRPFLRALHAYGLCQWRLGQANKARKTFERVLALNPTDNQGVRFCWNDVRNNEPWTEEGNYQSSLHSKAQPYL